MLFLSIRVVRALVDGSLPQQEPGPERTCWVSVLALSPDRGALLWGTPGA
jgi:hypothetical protein